MQDPPTWSDPRAVVEGLDGASCGAQAKTLAIEGIELAERGGTAEDWRRAVAARHADHLGWKAHLREAERCMRSAGLWPWTTE
jgi:hypothetical protein